MAAHSVRCAGSVRAAGPVFAVAIAAMVASGQPAAASGAAPSLNLSPSTDLHDGESVSVSVGANGFFTPSAHVNILECADPGGTEANLPKSISTCDGNTIQGNTILIEANGSFSEPDYTVYVLPSSTLGEQPNDQPVCDQSNPCVLYVGQNQNDFTAPKLFSAPFTIVSSSGTGPTTTAGVTTPTSVSTSTNASTTTVTTASPSTTSTSASAAAEPSVSLPASPASDPGALAATGPPTGVLWLAAMGAALFVTGTLGRRLSLKVRR